MDDEFSSALVGDTDAEIVALEMELRRAQLNADVAVLDRLLSDNLLFTGPDGQLGSKAQDLDAHKSGVVRFRTHDVAELCTRRVGTDVVLSAMRTYLVVDIVDVPVAGWFRYTRVWAREAGDAWRVVGGHVAAASPI